MSLIGAILCVVVMFLMSWVTALISFGCVIALFAGVIYRKPGMYTTKSFTKNAEYCQLKFSYKTIDLLNSLIDGFCDSTTDG